MSHISLNVDARVTDMNKDPAPLYYAARWRRVCALTVDCLVIFPLIIIQMKLARVSPSLHATSFVSLALVAWFYWIYCHGRWGRTLGKYLMGTRVVAMDGSRITWRQAFLRNAVEIGMGIIGWCAIIPANFQVPLDGYTELSIMERSQIAISFRPEWYAIFNRVQQGWMWSEIIVVLLNKKRRAMHDFIAGTVVVQKKPTRRQAKAEDPYAFDCAKEMKRLQKL
jgi:uncharacterized RDD family membrane protein YckC